MSTEKFRDRALSSRERAADLVGRLSLREKVGQLNQRLYGFQSYQWENGGLKIAGEFCREVERFGGLGVLYGLYRADPWSGRGYENGLAGEKAAEAYNMLQEYVITHSRFGIPMLLSSESPHGHQALEGYLLPVNLAQGAAWNRNLTRRAARVCGKQLREMGVDLALVSMLDVLRDPRWGRSEECFGEDPYLASALAEAVVKGFRAEGVDVVAKHFAAQGETTGGVNASAARIGERELREIHLPTAQAAVKAGARGVMAAYNEIDGIPCHNNRWLLQDILRGEMKFEGLIMADGFAVDRLAFLYDNPAACGAAALNSGVDVSLWDEGFSHLEEAYQEGLISMQRLDEAVCRVLTLKFERGLFEHPYLVRKAGISGGLPGQLPEDEANLQLARESVVLLKNEDELLPLTTAKVEARQREAKACSTQQSRKRMKIALVGENSRDIYSQMGDYTPPIRPETAWTVERGLQEMVRRHPFAELTVCGNSEEEAVRAAKECDVTVLVLGGSSSRFGNVTFDKNGAAVTEAVSGEKGAELPELCTKKEDAYMVMDCGEGVDLSSLKLPPKQRKLAAGVFAAGKKTVTIVLAGRPYDLTEIAAGTDALLYSFYPGPWGGRALAELLFGECSPSGRLPVSLPAGSGQLPVFYNHRISYEAIHYCDGCGPLYPFGYGMGYGTVSYGAFELSGKQFQTGRTGDGRITVKFRAVNSSGIQTAAVPMILLRHRGGSVIPRKAELKGFDKRLLQPGESCEFLFTITGEDLAVWDWQMRKTVEPGSVLVEIRDGDRTIWHTEITVEGEENGKTIIA